MAFSFLVGLCSAEALGANAISPLLWLSPLRRLSHFWWTLHGTGGGRGGSMVGIIVNCWATDPRTGGGGRGIWGGCIDLLLEFYLCQNFPAWDPFGGPGHVTPWRGPCGGHVLQDAHAGANRPSGGALGAVIHAKSARIAPP